MTSLLSLPELAYRGVAAVVHRDGTLHGVLGQGGGVGGRGESEFLRLSDGAARDPF